MEREDGPEEVFSVRAIAHRFDVDGSTVRRMIYKGLFPRAFKFGGAWKVPRGDVDEFVKRQQEKHRGRQAPASDKD